MSDTSPHADDQAVLVEAPGPGSATGIHLCGDGARHQPGPVTISTYVCPWCSGHGSWTGGERCMECHGSGTTNSPKPGIDLSRHYSHDEEPPTVEPVPLPRPPAVMRRPCVDCAYRPGAPEEEFLPGPGSPFWCHHGMQRVDSEDGATYIPAATAGGMPLGALLCAGWWALATGQPLPDAEFRDPGGADRHHDAPEPAESPR